MSLSIKDVLLNGETTNILIEGTKITHIGEFRDAEEVIDAKGMAAIPPFINGHTHAAMTLLRGFAEDLALADWLKDHIWPLENQLTEEDVYVGARLACLEMIKTGTTFFCDMYWHSQGTIRAVNEMGIRAAVSAVFIDFFDKDTAKEQIEKNKEFLVQTNDRVTIMLGPHSVYTVSEESLKWIAGFAREKGLLIHIHLSETEKEVAECVAEHGVRPVHYLDDIGFLGDNVLLSHCIWVDDSEIEILKKRGCSIVHNPVSNMKLSSGVLPYEKLKGLRMMLGTDGCASNNNLDMIEEMKCAGLLQKFATGNPQSLPAREILRMAGDGSFFGLDTGLEVGSLADLLLVDLSHHSLVPGHDLKSNLVYSARSECIDTTICNGRVLMRGRVVEGEKEIVDAAEKTAARLVQG
ncbi:MAG: amidohydrolase [Candidatus Woesearchaeota archaeon]